MTTKDRVSLNAADFSIGQKMDSGFIVLDFIHSGGLARDVKFRLGILSDGIARAGDGMDLNELERDLRAVAFISEQVDSSTVEADYYFGLKSETRFALFLTWLEGPQSPRISAAGVEVVHSDDTGFQTGPVLKSEEAINFMINSEMLREDDLSGAPVSPDPESRHFSELSVSGYRGFGEKRTLHFAKPRGSSGSGLTLIVGANNSGKSTFIEAIQSIARARQQTELSFPQPRRHHSTDAVTIELVRADDRRLRVETSRPGSSQAVSKWLPEGVAPDKFDIHVTPSRRNFNPYFGSTGVADRNWGLADQEFSRTQLRDAFVGRLRKVDRDAEARIVFDALLERIIGYPLEWTIDEIATGQQFLKLIQSDGAWHTSEGLGDGLVSLLFIVDALYDSEPGSMIAIDEPELSLHPQLIRRLRLELSRFAADRQVVVATHSPLLIDWTDIANGAVVARVYKAEGRSEIAQASEETLQKVATLADSRNVSNPHTVGTAAREAFFLEDGVILTEGQDDVAYLPRVFEDLGLPMTENIYGWGSGGAGNIPALAQLFRELGFTKIGAILDSDGQSGTLAALEKLKSMAPEVLVRQIPAADIRHKDPVIARGEVEGLLDHDNKHVRENLREGAAQILKEILDHVAPKAEES